MQACSVPRMFYDVTMKQIQLSDCRRGVRARIQACNLNEEQAIRIGEMGLRPGDTVEILLSSHLFGQVIAHGSERLAIDRKTARSILVSVLSPTLETL